MGNNLTKAIPLLSDRTEKLSKNHWSKGSSVIIILHRQDILSFVS